MIRDRKVKKQFDEIGKACYGFDSELELIIYRYLCRFHTKKKKLHALHNDLKFDTYRQWKQYVCNRYSNYRNEELMEFSRYLNHKKRCTSIFQIYWPIVAPIIISVLSSTVVQKAYDMYYDNYKNSSLFTLILQAFFILVVIIGLIISVIKASYILLENSMEENFYTDYKEIIDEMIQQKTPNGSFCDL